MNDKLFNQYIKALKNNDIPLINRFSELFLSNIEPNELIQRIKRFQFLDLLSLEDNKLKCEIEKILVHNNICNIINSYSVFQKGTRFYRVRLLDNQTIPNENLKDISDFWNPPVEYVRKYGRLNKPHESLLYTTFNPHTAIYEAHISTNELFVIFIYETKKDVKVPWIGSPTNYEHHNITNPKAICNHEILKNFLIDEFTRKVPQGQEQLYRITEHIAKEYFVAPESVGWRYPSIKDNGADNICFSSNNLNQNLDLVGGIVGTLCENEIFELEYVIKGGEVGNGIIYKDEEGLALFGLMFPEFNHV
ncbi:hypothetical protein ACPW7J_08045 [Ihubacter sp. rT4E-8]|uniref:hypothetical protein n=1 Tax=Ihubacter sp. rT4E-8 TaxID=3242369 RepID=UPI003CE70E16